MTQEALSATDKEIIQLFRRILAKKYYYLTILLLTGALSFYFLKFHLLSYQATASFYVSDRDILSFAASDVKAFEGPTHDNFNRTYELVNAANTHRYLIKKFDLVRHYNIDSTKEFYYEEAINKIRSSITVKKSPFNSISVTVSDRARYLAAEIANEIVAYVEKQNENFYLQNFARKAEVSKSFMNLLSQEYSQSSAKISELISQTGKLMTYSKENTVVSTLYQNLEQLSSSLNRFNASTTDLINSQKFYVLALEQLNFRNYPTITVLQIAMPAYRSNVYEAIGFSIGIMLVIAAALVLQNYFFMWSRNYFARLNSFEKFN